MCSFVGISSLKKDLCKDVHVIKDMNMKLKKKEINEEKYFLIKNINIGVINTKDKVQPMSVKYNDNTYTIVCNGQIYNKDEIKKELIELGYKFERRF